jgi:hypothetical protein
MTVGDGKFPEWMQERKQTSSEFKALSLSLQTEALFRCQNWMTNSAEYMSRHTVAFFVFMW